MNLDQQPIRARSRQRRVGSAILRAIEIGCWFGGILAIVSVALISWNSVTFQSEAAKRLGSLETIPVQKRIFQPGDPFGRISIPRIGVSAIVAEGVDETTLRRAVGHFPESAVPETAGTVALAGHRDTFFRGLANIKVKDLVMLETPSGKYQYEVVRTAVVGPQRVELVQPSSKSDLTLVTCFPFHYIGPAPERFIVQAMRIRAE